MSQTELFDFPIKQLPERYGIARSAVYVRMKRLNVTPHTQGNRSYINASQLNLLDDLHDFLCEDSSRTIDDFLRSLSAVELTPQAVSSTGQLTRQQTGHLPGQPLPEFPYKPESHAERLRERFEFLERASSRGWLLSTSDLALLIGLEPTTVVRHEQLSRWGFTFVKCAERTGREVNWVVEHPK
ncbi:MAG TPA: hypothetical protein V6C95_01010 [Coleofasciculaceae cyanobacterium]